MSTKALSLSQIEKFHKDFSASPKNLMARNAVTRSSILDVALCRDATLGAQHTFSHQVKPEVRVTNQKASGRCWIFAALNAMRLPLMQKYKLEKFEFSQAYHFFWDKLEKSNFFLENILATQDEPLDGRLMQWLLSNPVEDGGQWHMFVSLINKYGAVPQEAMPESFHSSSSARLNWLLTFKLREFARVLRDDHAAGKSLASLRKDKQLMLQEVYKILAIHLGDPPSTFDWRFRDKKKAFKQFNDLTPQTFLKKHVPYNVEDKVCLINAPTKDKPFNKLYSVDFLGNVHGGVPVTYINLPIQSLRDYTIRSLKGGEAVWFGCDVGKHFHQNLGVMDPELYDYNLVFDTNFNLDKGQRLDYGESLMTHAMAFTGVDLKKSKATKWRVENSWGEIPGNKGFFSMSDSWFEEYVYEVVVDKKYVPKSVLNILKQKPEMLAPWDPMGSLA